MIKIVIYREPYRLSDSPRRRGKRVRPDDYVPDERSLRRTKDTIRDIALENDFDLFCTFTFDKTKHDRYNYDHCKYVLETWLATQRNKRNSPNLRYLVVPELHKDGAIHFHALLGGFNGVLKPSGKKVQGRPIYNFSGYRGGFSTACFIDNKEAVAHYITKYITKDFLNQYGRKRYFCSRYLNRPKRSVNKYSLKDIPPLFRKKVFENDTCEIYNIDPALFQPVARVKNKPYTECAREYAQDHPEITLDKQNALGYYKNNVY